MSDEPRKETRTPKDVLPATLSECPDLTVADMGDFLRSSRQAPSQFLSLVRKRGVRVPSDQETMELADLLAGNQKALERAVRLGVSCPVKRDTSALGNLLSGTLWHVLANTVPDLLAPSASTSVEEVADSVATIRRGAKSKRRAHLLLCAYVLVAVHSDALGQCEVDAFVASVFATQSKSKGASRDVRRRGADLHQSTSNQTLFPMLPRAGMLLKALAIRETYQAQARELEVRLSNAHCESERLVLERNENRTALESAEAQIRDLKEVVLMLQRQSSEQRMDAEAQHANAMHDRQILKGRLKGSLRGELARWLLTAQDAANANPPRTNVITERLVQSLDLIEKEARWLESLD